MQPITMPVQRRTLAVAWHDVTCPEGPECRSREMHALGMPLASSGMLYHFLARLSELQLVLVPSEEENV